MCGYQKFCRWQVFAWSIYVSRAQRLSVLRVLNITNELEMRYAGFFNDDQRQIAVYKK